MLTYCVWSDELRAMKYMSATKNFRRNFRSMLRDQKYTLAAFAEKVDMDVSKIQRMQDLKKELI